MLERDYQAQLVQKLKKTFPGIIILKTDSGYMQGFPDLLLLYMNKWAALEVKANQYAIQQPNQEYYVHLLGEMSFSAFIFPENEEEILSELQFAFQPERNSRISFR